MMPFARFPVRALVLCTALLGAACGDASPSADGAAAPDTVATPADTTPSLAPPDFAEGAINSVAFEGSYACDPGFAPEITLSDDGTTKAFSAYLHERLFTSGTWSWDGTTLRIESTAGSFAFTDVEIGDGTMVLGTGAEQWACRNLPSEMP
jgi:hypothetical protein